VVNLSRKTGVFSYNNIVGGVAMSVPYLGNKQKIASTLVEFISTREKSKTIADLMCGGMSVSAEFINHGFNVIANDINKYVVALEKQVIEQGIPKEYYDWVSSDKFKDVVVNPDNYEPHYTGYVLTIWSFGNSMDYYLFGLDKEDAKRAAHEIVVNGDWSLIDDITNHLFTEDLKYIASMFDMNQRRLALNKWGKDVEKSSKDILDKDMLEDLKRLQLEPLTRIQQLERLQQLSGLQDINTNNLTVSNKDYKDVELPEDCIVYCDIPYRRDRTHYKTPFNHDEFYEWVREIGKTHPVYISEYEMPDEFELVLELEKRSLINTNRNERKVNTSDVERLFYYFDKK